ncbi:MAG: immunity 53 family protein [Chloroflexi bacterium]|nr:immunity 53 family protein [Chloroflexota bacterium]
MTGALAGLQDWYRNCCDGEWEHHYGVTIQSLDNPGWLVTIDLAGTALIDCRFDAIDARAGGTEWMHCAVQDAQFRAAGASTGWAAAYLSGLGTDLKPFRESTDVAAGVGAGL